MARLEFRLPDIGEGIAEAEIVEWHAAAGDAVKEGQTMVAVMTDKATVELEAPADGILVERHGEIGAMLPVGTVLFALETEEATVPEARAADARRANDSPKQPPEVATPPPPGPQRPASARESECGPRALASPAVRQRARALGIDLASVAATGEQIRHEDLDRQLLAQAPPPPAATRAAGPHDIEIPLAGLRRQIARRMQEAKRHIPHFTYVEEIDVTALELLRGELNGRAGERAPLRLLPFLVAALCRAVRDFPTLNAHYDDRREVLTQFGAADVGIATQTDGGLMVPVLRDAGTKDIWQIADEIRRLAAGARAGELGREELRGSTITVSSLGRLGGIAATPIINRPEVAIVAPHRIFDRPVLSDGQLETRKVMNLSISCDHRVIDGYVAAAFVQAIRQSLEAPDDLAPA